MIVNQGVGRAKPGVPRGVRTPVRGRNVLEVNQKFARTPHRDVTLTGGEEDSTANLELSKY